MAQRLSPEAAKRQQQVTEDVYGVPRGLISRDPEAAAIIATTPCEKCGSPHGIKPCPPQFGRFVEIPVARPA